MTFVQAAVVVSALVASSATMAATASMDQMRWQRRVLLASSPNRDDPRLLAQQHILAGWQDGASDRDVTFVQIAGSGVSGTGDEAAALRERYRLDATTFEALLIGKDGHVALRSRQPIDADTLQSTIDAMPMRRNGGR